MTGNETGRPAGSTARIAPGLALAATAGFVCLIVNALIPALSALLVAIILGVVAVNTGHLPERVGPGLAIASKRVLRVGIVLLGLQVSLVEIAHLGLGMLGTVVCVVAGGILTAEMLGRVLGVAPAQRSLIGAGFSICGAAAVAGVEGLLRDKKDEDVVTAIALVVLFGTLMIPLVPLAASGLGLDPHRSGLWAGASIHEVAQVVAAGGIMGEGALTTAVVVKLARVLMLAPVALCFSWRARRSAGEAREGGLPPLVPLFVLGFVAASVVRTTGILPAGVLDAAKMLQTFLLAAAMFALGCGVRLATLRAVGGRPVLLAAMTTTTIAAIALVGVHLVA